MGTISNIISEESNHLKNNYSYFNDEELKEVVDIAEKYHEDNTYDYKANMKTTTLAKLVKNLIIDKEANKDKYIKQALDEIYLLADINKDRENIKKTVEEGKEDTKKFLQEYVEHEKQQRNMMEHNLLEKAEQCENPEEKARMIATSLAYTNGYNFKRFIDYIHTEEFEKDMKKYSKKKYFKRLLADCDYIVSKVAGTSMTFTEMVCKFGEYKFTPALRKYLHILNDFVLALAIHLSKTKLDDKADLLYAYNIVYNINHLFGIRSFATNFDKEKDKYLEEALDAFAGLHTNDEANVG